MLHREIIAVCSQIHTKHINTLCGQNVELLNVKLEVHIFTTAIMAISVTQAVQVFVVFKLRQTHNEICDARNIPAGRVLTVSLSLYLSISLSIYLSLSFSFMRN